MAKLTKCLTSISLDRGSGPSPGRRLLAVVLCAMLALGSTFPGVALAGEADSEGVGTAPTVEVPVAPDFDPGGEESALEETPAAGGDEEGAPVEAESEVEAEAPAAGEVTTAATEVPVEALPPPVAVPEPVTSAPEPEPVHQQAQQEPELAISEPVANQSIVAPRQRTPEHRADFSGGSAGEASVPGEAPSVSPPQSAATPPANPGLDLGGKDSYVVRPGDCLWHIAAALLPAGASVAEIVGEVARLWKLNKAAIGTDDPSLIYAGTTLRLR